MYTEVEQGPAISGSLIDKIYIEYPLGRSFEKWTPIATIGKKPKKVSRHRQGS
jgi:hypothetical protein